MDLDQGEIYQELDPSGIIAQICRLPEDLWEAYQAGTSQTALIKNYDRVIIAGVGGAGSAADFLVAFLETKCAKPVFVLRNDRLPAWVTGDDTLLICVAHEGTELETVSGYREADLRGVAQMVITTGGVLLDLARADGVPAIVYPGAGDSNAAIGWILGHLFAIFTRMGWYDAGDAIREAVAVMKEQMKRQTPDVPVFQNPAKRMAGQLVNRMVAIAAADELIPVARRWKEQINSIAKAWAQMETLPDMTATTLAATCAPEELLGHLVVVFLRGCESPINRLRSDLTRQNFLLEGISTDFFDAPGAAPLAQMLAAAHFGDFVAYYLAIAYGIDPAPAPVLKLFAQTIAEA